MRNSRYSKEFNDMCEEQWDRACDVFIEWHGYSPLGSDPRSFSHEDWLRARPDDAEKILKHFEWDWAKLAEEWADNPAVIQAIKDEIARRLSGAEPATS